MLDIKLVRSNPELVKEALLKRGAKVSLDEFADSKGIDMLELISEIEAIVNFGTKVNIDYHLDQILDKENQD